MKTVSQVVGLMVLAMCVSAGANEIDRGNSRNVATKHETKQTLAVETYSPTQVFCMKRLRTGSRVSRNVCQTLAAWKQEMDEKAMRRHLIKPGGRAASWETSP